LEQELLTSMLQNSHQQARAFLEREHTVQHNNGNMHATAEGR
jgi:hypothetical protein